MKKYIDLNTSLRAKASSDFEKDSFKLMNNSVFGKRMENLRIRVNIKLVTSEKEAFKLVSQPNYDRRTIFSEYLVAVHMKPTEIYYHKPVYLGMCTLDLSKTLIYDFHYNYTKAKFGSIAKLLFTDTDSLAYETETLDLYRVIVDDTDDRFDTSNFRKDHFLFTDKNKKVPGLLKDEAGGEQILEFVGLRP